MINIISQCLFVERKGSDPFDVRIKQILETMREYLPKWKLLEDFNLDAETLNQISTIIRLQGKWLKHRSSSLYVDPLLIELKIKMINPIQLAKVLIKTWHPIVELERLSSKRISEAVSYWNQLLPLEERVTELPSSPNKDLESTTIEDLLESKIISKKAFSEVLELLWEELKQKALETGNVSYWDFILMDTYEDTVVRAYLTSFLITYGYATLEVNSIEEQTFIIPSKDSKPPLVQGNSVSVAIPLDFETWKNMRIDKK